MPTRVSVNLLNILQVLQFMVDEKLPKEIAAKKLELQVYEDVINEKNINKQFLNNLQNQVSPLCCALCTILCTHHDYG